MKGLPVPVKLKSLSGSGIHNPFVGVVIEAQVIGPSLPTQFDVRVDHIAEEFGRRIDVHSDTRSEEAVLQFAELGRLPGCRGRWLDQIARTGPCFSVLPLAIESWV